MRSSTGVHYVALDHVRALAAYLVFLWHFLHGQQGHPITWNGAPPTFPFAILDQGHTGVALFMVLSGYLFAKILDGRRITYSAFFWNRFVRLAPLLVVSLGVVGLLLKLDGGSLVEYAKVLVKGLVLPVWPNGGRSITAELHFYLALPLLLLLIRRARWLPLVVLAAAIVVRAGLLVARGEIQDLAYWTILGRIDQFVLGMMAFHYRDAMRGRHGIAALVAAVVLVVFWTIERLGIVNGGASPLVAQRFWVLWPTFEALVYGCLIAWYDASFAPLDRGFSAFVGLIGKYSYSIPAALLRRVQIGAAHGEPHRAAVEFLRRARRGHRRVPGHDPDRPP